MGVYDKDIKRDIDAINELLKGVRPSKKSSFGQLSLSADLLWCAWNGQVV